MRKTVEHRRGCAPIRAHLGPYPARRMRRQATQQRRRRARPRRDRGDCVAFVGVGELAEKNIADRRIVGDALA